MEKIGMKDKVVIVTGASSGIGKATAHYFSAKGAKVVIAARRLEVLEDVAAEMLNNKAEVLAVKADVSKEEDCQQLIEKTVEAFGKIDVLINNAGISMRAIFNELELDVFRSVMQVNFWGAVYCTKFALPYLLKTKGSVVGVSSIAGYVGLPARTAYSASKYALHGFLEALRTENLEKDLHVLIACPGFTASNIRKVALMADGNSQSKSPREEKKMMSAEDVARYLHDAVVNRKQKIVLTTEGKMAVFLSKFLPKFVQKAVFNKMKKEPNSPL